MKRICVLIMFSVSALLLSGCASKPEQELTAAEQAVEQAQAAEADVYAPTEFQAASDALTQAQTEIAAQDEQSPFSRSYDKAKELLGTSKTQAEAAAAAAGANKEKAQSEAQALQAEALQAVELAKTALSAAPRGKGAQADLEALQADLTAAETSLNEAQQALQAGKIMDALNQYKAVKSKVDSIQMEIQQAVEKKKGGRRV